MEQIEVGSVKTRPFTKYDADYKALVVHMQATLNKRMEGKRSALFRTKTEMKPTPQMVENGISVDVTLNHVYLGALTEDERQYHTCSCCASFMKHYAGLVTIDAKGKTQSVLWDSETFPQDNYYFTLVERMQEVIESGRVIGTFQSPNETWGEFVRGGFEHFGVISPVDLRFRRRDISGGQRQAEQRDAFYRMSKGFSTDLYSMPNLMRLMRLVDADVLPGDEIIKGATTWLVETATERATATDRRVKDNLLWRAIAAASEGWTRKKTMTGTVLQDLLDGLSFDDIKAKFKAKTQADVYRRPVAAPKNGAIEQAEKLFETLGIQTSVRRRVAYLSDLPESAFIWHERDAVRANAEPAKGIFGHLREPSPVEIAKEDLQLPPVTMSWNKFMTDVFPKAQDFEYYVSGSHDFFAGLTTQAVEDAQPILMYDFDDARNPVSAYQRSDKHPYNGQLIGTHPSKWNLTSGAYVQVQAIIKGPHQFGAQQFQFPQLGEMRFFILQGGYDVSVEQEMPGLALFPALMRTELHGVSSVIEAFSNKGRFEGDVKQQAIGVTISRGNPAYPRRLRVQTSYGPRVIIIDRWE
jgi:hypothetical protein